MQSDCDLIINYYYKLKLQAAFIGVQVFKAFKHKRIKRH